jgi:high-affinity iron transporter
MLATFIIFLREGVEASMIVAILLAYLSRTGQRGHFRDIYFGVGSALLLAAAGGVAAYLTISEYDGSRFQTIFETCTYLLAAAVLTYMTFWMRNHARTISTELRAKVDSAVDGNARRSMFLLAFQAVGREGLETAVFTLAIFFSGRSEGAVGTRGPAIGGAVGIVVALAIAFFIYRLGHQINFRVFFATVGGLLMVFAAGLLVDAIQNMQELGWIRFATHRLWDSGTFINEDSAPGDLLHSMFGYSQQPTVLQVVVYLTYLTIILSVYFGLSKRMRRHA